MVEGANVVFAAPLSCAILPCNKPFYTIAQALAASGTFE
jgi:hypothetical protein